MAICRASCPSFVTNFYLISRSFTPVSSFSLSFSPSSSRSIWRQRIYLLYAHTELRKFSGPPGWKPIKQDARTDVGCQHDRASRGRGMSFHCNLTSVYKRNVVWASVAVSTAQDVMRVPAMRRDQRRWSADSSLLKAEPGDAPSSGKESMEWKADYTHGRLAVAGWWECDFARFVLAVSRTATTSLNKCCVSSADDASATSQ